jgi:membrane associated rhomboid family serine protease
MSNLATKEAKPVEPKKKGFRIRYNSPVILTFAVICSVVMAIGTFMPGFVSAFFTVPGNQQGFNFLSLDLVKLFTHAIGHFDWAHLLGNFSFILLIGPILEEKYGSWPLLLMMCITAGVTGALNVLFFSSGLLGASGVAFMMILLISFTNIKYGEIPLTFILVCFLFLGKEIWAALFEINKTSEFAHIIGGVTGSLFGFVFPDIRNKTKDPIDTIGT